MDEGVRVALQVCALGWGSWWSWGGYGGRAALFVQLLAGAEQDMIALDRGMSWRLHPNLPCRTSSAALPHPSQSSWQPCMLHTSHTPCHPLPRPAPSCAHTAF
jgi:hypothetical protein